MFEVIQLFPLDGEGIPNLPLLFLLEYIFYMRLQVAFILRQAMRIDDNNDGEGRRTSVTGSHWSLGRSLCCTLAWEAALKR